MPHPALTRVVALLGAVAASCLAQESEPVEPADDAALSKTSFSLSFGGVWIGKSDLDASPGEVGIARVGTRLGVSHELSEKVALTFGAELEHSVYDFDGATGLVAGSSDPFDDATIATLSLGARFRAGQSNTWSVTGFVRSAGESGADFNDTLTGGGIVGFAHEFSDDLTLGVGVVASSELEGDVYIVPFPIIRWRFAEGWTLSNGGGAGLELACEINDKWTLGAEAGWDRREFRLDDTGALPSGVVEERHVPVGLFARFVPNANITLDARVGANAWSQLDIDNSAGVRVAEDDIDPAIYAGLDLTVHF